METDLTLDLIADRLGKCEVCAAINAKYTCPKCEVKTCCLKCVNIHKKELNCDGIRDPTKFVTLNNFTNVDLLNDYRMLEQVGRVVEGLHRNKFPNEYIAGRRILPKYLHVLKQALSERKITVDFLPKNFERRLNNKTYFKKQKQHIYWSVEWIFPHADNFKILENNCSEQSKLKSILHKYLTGQLEQYQNEKLNFYQSAGFANVTLLLKAEHVKGEKHYLLDPELSICDNLKGKILIEYPTILVVLKGHEEVYDIIQTDCDEEMEEPVLKKSRLQNEGNVVLAQLLNEAAKEENVKSKNLLFISEYSDAELSTDDDT